MRALARLGMLGVLVVGLGGVSAAATATTATLSELPTVTSQTGSRAPNQVPAPRLRAGITYRASLFPVALRFTTPNGSWSGAQGRTLTKGVSSTERGRFGFVELRQAAGAISLITADGRTPTVAATVKGLRTRGRGATFQATSPVKLAGLSGVQFDGEVVGTSHNFVPFTPPSGAAKFVPDSYTVNQGDMFRLVVLNVRSKTVVVLFESEGLPTDEFTAFLGRADEILKTLRFPKG
jgi:hypothetical protein